MSKHAIEIVEIGEVVPHPNADKMEITHIWGWQCCVGKGQFQSGGKAVYVPPDYMVPTSHPSFAFLRKEGRSQERITVRRFRGSLSQGLLISVPEELSSLPVGSNVMEQLGIERYEPPAPKSTFGMFVSAPSELYLPKFDVENYQRYKDRFAAGESVVVTEKIHGANGRFVWGKNPKTGELEQFCGSRTNWMAQDETNIWWLALKGNPQIGDWCRANPWKVIYGEVFGQVQNLKYGAGRNDIFFAAFAVLDRQRWLNYDEWLPTAESFGVKTAPLVYRGPFDEKLIYEMAEKDSSWPKANHMREGVVVVPEIERTDPEIGRVLLKVVSNRYLEKC